MAELDLHASSHQLERKAMWTAAVWPLILPRGTAQVRPGEVCSVAGWGRVAPNGRGSDTLQEVELTVQQDQECKFYFSNNYNSTTQLCVGDPKEKKSSFQVRLSICLAQLWGEGCLGKIWDLESQAVGTPSPPRL